MMHVRAGVEQSSVLFWWYVWASLVLIGVPAVAIGVTVWWSARRGRVDLAAQPVRRALYGRLIGLGVGVITGVVAWWFFAPWLATALVIAGYLVGVLVGELLAAPRPGGPVRIASLRPRTGRTYVPHWPARLAVGAALVTVASPVLFALLPRLHYASWAGLPAGSAAWPALGNSAPVALGAIGALLAGAVVVGRLVALPPVTTDPPISEQARTNSVRAAVGAVLGIELLFLAYTALGATHGLHTPYPESDLSSGWVAAGWAVHVLNWGAVALMVASVVTACALGRWRRPAAMQLTINSAHPARP